MILSVDKNMYCPKCKPKEIMFNVSSKLAMAIGVMNFQCENCKQMTALKVGK